MQIPAYSCLRVVSSDVLKEASQLGVNLYEEHLKCGQFYEISGDIIIFILGLPRHFAACGKMMRTSSYSFLQ